MDSVEVLQGEISNKPAIDFTTPWDKDLEKYPLDDSTPQVTRDNFTRFLVQSFAVSHGEVPAQVLYIKKWLSARTGQDLIQIIADFVNAGGTNRLSIQERDFVLKAIQGVITSPTHQTVNEENLNIHFSSQLRMLFPSGHGTIQAIAMSTVGSQDLASMPRPVIMEHIHSIITSGREKPIASMIS